MRSLKYYAVALPLHFLAADAGRPQYDTTVVVTQTRTVTVCPVVDLFKCAQPEPTRPWKDWTTKATTTSTTTTTVTTSTTSKEGEGEQTTKSTSSGETTKSTSSGEVTTTKSTSSGETTKSTSSGEVTSSTTTKSTSSGEVTTTSSSHSESSTTSTSTTTSSSTTSKGPWVCPTGGNYTCPSGWEREGNKAGARDKWLDGMSIENDSHDTKYSSGKTVNYKFELTQGTYDADGNGAIPVMLVNGMTPGPVIEANWGDWIEVEVTNKLVNNVTSIHWHGIRQEGTNDQDGVPGVTECGIAPGSTRVYKFKATSYGTGWYHSHALSQYAAGIRGAMVIHGPATADYDFDMGPIMIDEKLRESAFTLSYSISRFKGPLPPASNVLFNGKNTSPDNTKGTPVKYSVRSGKKHLFRIINSSAQSAYAVRFDNHTMKVISADYVPIVPYTTDVLYLGSGQRYNVIVEANQNSSAYYMRAITQTGCGSTAINDGRSNANLIFEYDDAADKTPLVANTSSIVVTSCKDEPLASLVPYKPKSGGSYEDFLAKVKLVGASPAEIVDTTNTTIIKWFMGPPDDMSKNNVNYTASKGINVTYEEPTLKLLHTVSSQAVNVSSSAYAVGGSAKEWVYFVLQSSFQTSHPMHLHGHDFSLIGQGKGVFDADKNKGDLIFTNPPRRDSANLYAFRAPPNSTLVNSGGWTVIGFQPDNPGAWLMHCHVLWHADAGMGLQYIENQGDIQDYYGKQEFKDQCAAVEDYHTKGGAHKADYESGLKRHLAEHAGHAKRHGHAI